MFNIKGKAPLINLIKYLRVIFNNEMVVNLDYTGGNFVKKLSIAT